MLLIHALTGVAIARRPFGPKLMDNPKFSRHQPIQSFLVLSDSTVRSAALRRLFACGTLFEFQRLRAFVLGLFNFAELGDDLDKLLGILGRRQVSTVAEDN